MARRAQIHLVTIRSSLVHLPISIYGPLLERSIRPQNLAVHLTLSNSEHNAYSLGSKVEAFVGWTGMASASSLARFNLSDTSLETIEIDPQYAQALGFAHGDVVEIGLLYDLPFAKSVGTEPLSADDWEIIELHASHVESTLLSQVRAAKIGQEIDVWVLGTTRVRLRVVFLDPQSTGNALLLTTNTEVSIAPALRSTRNGSITSVASHFDTIVSSNAATELATAKFAPKILRLLPSRLFPFFNQPTSSYTRPETLAYVSALTFAQLTKSSFPLSDSVKASRLFHKATLRRLDSPVNPVENTLSGYATGAVPRVLDALGVAGANDGDKDSEAGPKNTVEVFLGWAEDVPESHVLFASAVEGIDEWELIRITATSCCEPSSKLFGKSDRTPPPIHDPPSLLASSDANLLAGVDNIITRCKDFCLGSFVKHTSMNAVLGVSALLLTGRPGSGKTSIVQAIAESLQDDSRIHSYTYYVDLTRHSGQPISTLKSLFRHWFEKAAWHRPTILILDNMDKLMGAEVEHTDSFRVRHITEIFISLYAPSARSTASNFRGIVLLGTASSQLALHPLISRAHIFSSIVNVQSPNKDARKDIITRIVQRRLTMAPDIQQDPESPLNYIALATQTEGYSANDLRDLVARAMHQAAIRAAEKMGNTSATLMNADFQTAQIDFVPLSLREITLQKSDVAWSDIGGLKEARRVLRETLEWPTKYGPIFAQSPLRLRSGLLLYGFPGCGKTLLASAVAKECGLNFISVKGPEILNKYIGASEKSVRDLFERASAAKPCVLFFDEFDSIAPKRGHDSTGVTDRVVNQMLTQMDGAEGLEGVYVLAATSRPDLIDSALLRPGRLDKLIFCDMPDTKDRNDILQAVGRKITMSPSINWGEVAEATEGFSGADLQALIYNAHLEIVHASIASETGSDTNIISEEQQVKYMVFGSLEGKSVRSNAEELAIQRRLRQIVYVSHGTHITTSTPLTKVKKCMITESILRQVLKSTRPSVSPKEQARLCNIYQDFVSGRSGGFPVPPDGGGLGNRVSLM